MFDDLIYFIRDHYGTDGFIPLHSPRFIGNEKKYLLKTIDSTYVSSIGEYVDLFENSTAEYTGAKYAIATVNGTAALHISLKLVGVENNSEVITQSLTFIATCNAIRYCGATPVLLDVDRATLGLSAKSLKLFLDEYGEVREDGNCWNKVSNKKIAACLPMHTFGIPVELDAIKQICDQYNIPLVEDAAESLGSRYKDKHTGIYGKTAAISFNGNKIITTGGGGIILTNDEQLNRRARHITTTAKIPHNGYFFEHDEIGFNYRLPNLNAALGVAQLEVLPAYVKDKRKLAKQYHKWGDEHGLQFVKELKHSKSNYWMNTVVTQNKKQRDVMLKIMNENKIMTRPAWVPMHKLEINQDCYFGNMTNTEWLFDRLVNIPSSTRGI